MNRDEQQTPTKIAVLGGGALGVTKQHIAKLLESVGYHTHVVPGTTTILATAIMPSGFTLATAESRCLNAEDFTLQMGIEVAITKAKALAHDALWQFEGYRLKQTLHEIEHDHGRAALDRLRATVQPAAHRHACGYLDSDPSACDCPGGPCSAAVEAMAGRG